jgi:hypothetical protein
VYLQPLYLTQGRLAGKGLQPQELLQTLPWVLQEVMAAMPVKASVLLLHLWL